jgi:hypothetical protein
MESPLTEPNTDVIVGLNVDVVNRRGDSAMVHQYDVASQQLCGGNLFKQNSLRVVVRVAQLDRSDGVT